MKYSPLTLALLVVAAPLASAQGTLPAGAKLTKIEVRPPAVELKSPYDYRQLLLTGVLEGGDKIDVTRLVQFKVPEALVKVSPGGEARPVADGAGELKFTLAGQAGAIPIKVSGQKEKHTVSFVKDVMPAMTRLGCNAGTCHGSAKGRNGFQLSLRGYDPIFDHRALIDDISGRRFNRAAPDRSLMLLKPAGAVAHGGGVLIQPGEPYYELIRNWIAQGAKLDLESPRVQRIEVLPTHPVLPLPGSAQQMTVLAHYADGSTRDVTAEAVIVSSNTEVATADKQGLVTAVRRGETAMLARYEGNYAAAPMIILGDRTGFAWQPTPEFNWIDTLVYQKLKDVKIQASDICTEADFLRRLYLDLTGLPPEPEAVRAFLKDDRPSKVKRDEMIDKLVGSPDFIEHWTNRWADLLQVNRKFLGEQGAMAFRTWIKDALVANMPYNEFCYKVLTATGSNMENPAAAYFKILRDPDQAMENTTHLFLAVRFNCNKCHDHPFERWTQDQYYTLASYFAQISRGEDPKFKGQKTQGNDVRGALPLVEIIADKKDGEVKHERTGQIAQPKFPFEHASMPPTTASRREQLAKWITSKDNPFFARSYANRVWSYLLGVGIIEPVDDLRAGNPPTNPPLLDRLTAEFVKSNFNVQEMIKTICKSRTYQHSIVTNKWNKDDDQNYSHAVARRLPAEVLFDAIHRATGSQTKLPGLPPGARAAQLVDSSVPIPGSFLELFGKPPRKSACECERTNSMLLGPILNLVNGPVLAEALRDPGNRIAKILATEKDDSRLVEELYLAILCRSPSDKEIKLGLEALRDNDEDFAELVKEKNRRKAALDDLEKRLPQIQAAWEQSVTRTPSWTVLDPSEMKAAAGTTLTKQADLSIFASDKNPSPEVYTITAKTNLVGITGMRLETLTDDRLPKKGPGRSPNNGNFVLNEFKVEFAPTNSKDPAKEAKLTRPQADFSQDQFPIANAIDNNPATGWAISPQVGRNHTAVFEVADKFGFKDGTTITFTLSQLFAGKDHNIGKFRLSITTAKPPVLLQGTSPPDVTKILDTPSEARTPEQKAKLTGYYRSIDPDLGRLSRHYGEFTIPSSPRALGAQDLAWALLNSPAFLFNH